MGAKSYLQLTIVAASVGITLGAATAALAATTHRSLSDSPRKLIRVAVPSQVAGATLNPRTGKLTLTGGASHHAPADAAAPESQCYVKTEKNRKFKGYTPWHNSAQGTSHIFDWLNQLYSISDARYLSGHFTYQVQFCSVGGGNTHNGWHEYFIGNALYVYQKADSKIKWTWGTGASKNGHIATSLNFSVAKGPVNIGASTTVTTGVGNYEGDFGEDGNFYRYPTNLKRYNLNRVNTYFLSPSSWPWDGTAHFEGNTGQVVYEWSMNYIRKHPPWFGDVADMKGFCAAVNGCSKRF